MRHTWKTGITKKVQSFPTAPLPKVGIHLRGRGALDGFRIPRGNAGNQVEASVQIRSAMWIVRLALRRPYTFVVFALLIAVLGVMSAMTMSVDIFPSINIPVITVIWIYSGLSPTEMEGRIITVSERAFTTTVNGIEHIESVSLRGLAVTRLYFHPNVLIDAALAQVTAQAQQIVRVLPPGIFPPQISQYNAASVPVVLANLSSD